MNIRPFGKNILIKPDEKKQILMADQGSLCEYGEVLAVGDQVQNVRVGQRIGFLIWGINKLQIEEETFYFLPEGDFILGFIE